MRECHFKGLKLVCCTLCWILFSCSITLLVNSLIMVLRIVFYIGVDLLPSTLLILVFVQVLEKLFVPCVFCMCPLIKNIGFLGCLEVKQSLHVWVQIMQFFFFTWSYVFPYFHSLALLYCKFQIGILIDLFLCSFGHNLLLEVNITIWWSMTDAVDRSKPNDEWIEGSVHCS